MSSLNGPHNSNPQRFLKPFKCIRRPMHVIKLFRRFNLSKFIFLPVLILKPHLMSDLLFKCNVRPKLIRLCPRGSLCKCLQLIRHLSVYIRRPNWIFGWLSRLTFKPYRVQSILRSLPLFLFWRDGPQSELFSFHFILFSYLHKCNPMCVFKIIFNKFHS